MPLCGKATSTTCLSPRKRRTTSAKTSALVRFVDDFSLKNGHLTFDVFDLIRGNREHIAIPDGNVRILAHFKRAGSVLDEHLMRTPDCVGAESRLDIDGLFGSERRRAGGG